MTENEVEENTFYAACQSFIYQVVIKLVFSGQVLLNKDPDGEEVTAYFTEYRFAELDKIIDQLSYLST